MSEDALDEEFSSQMAACYAKATTPSEWPDFSSDQANEVFIFTALHCLTHVEDKPKAETFYVAYFQQAPRASRLQALGELSRLAEGAGEIPLGMTMDQFLFEETDQQILLTAALYFCIYAFPGPDGDVTRGAEMVIEAMQMRLGEAGEFAAGTLAGGIMVVGDTRFVPRMQQAWKILGQDGRDCMIASRGIACCHAHVEFLLWSLENTDDPKNFGRAADALIHLANEAEANGVIDTRRTVPVSSNPQNPITIVERWSVQEYGEQIHQRLSALAAREGEDHDKVMPAVMERWARA